MNKTTRLLAQIACVLGAHVAIASAPVPVPVNIEPQPLDRAIRLWAQQTGYQVLFPAEERIENLMSTNVNGSMTPSDALANMLSGTGLSYQLVNARTVAIHQSAEMDRYADLPLSPIERLEVLPACASGIYGGSATAGAIKILFRRNYSFKEADAHSAPSRNFVCTHNRI